MIVFLIKQTHLEGYFFTYEGIYLNLEHVSEVKVRRSVMISFQYYI